MSPTPPRHPITVPLGRTARRLDWMHLPPAIRRAVEGRLGSPVTEAESRTSGYTPGFASVLCCADGSRHFVKAASLRAQRGSASSYREEARKLRMIPPTVPAPRLQWVMEEQDWVVLGIEYAPGTPPARPWAREELLAVSRMLVHTAELLTPAPGIGIPELADDVADWPAAWSRLGYLRQRDGSRRIDEAAGLAERFGEVLRGDTLVHGDVRDDNLLIADDGTVSLCDWTWPCRGPAWFDSLCLLIGAYGDGLDVEGLVRDHPLLGPVPAEDIDTVLALMAGYLLDRAEAPSPRAAPWVREIQRWQGEVCWEWLRERRS